MIYCVIAVHNRKAFTLGCLACLARQTITEHRVIVVDDGSTDGTCEQIRQDFPDTIILTGDGSLWWAGATNLGIRHVLKTFSPCANDFILTLNDDTKTEPDYLASLLMAYQANQLCIIGSVSVDVHEPDKLLYAGTGLNVILPHISDWADTIYKNRIDLLNTQASYFPSDTLPGRGMLIPMSVFNVIGLFDEQHFQHHMADLDFSIRARKAGFPLIISPKSIVYEYADATGITVTKPMSVRQFRQALSSIKSPINFTVRYHFARKHSPLTLVYFALDMLRILLGYANRRLQNLIH
ncbi:glycosyltransferase family 2 protein [Spirosoma aerophilum]